MSNFGQGNLGKMKKYIVSASYDGQMVSSFSLESISNSPDRACDRFLNFFLIRRSGFFELTPDDITPIQDTKEKLEVPKNTDSDFRYQVIINDKPLVIDFFPMKFVI